MDKLPVECLLPAVNEVLRMCWELSLEEQEWWGKRCETPAAGEQVRKSPHWDVQCLLTEGMTRISKTKGPVGTRHHFVAKRGEPQLSEFSDRGSSSSSLSAFGCPGGADRIGGFLLRMLGLLLLITR